MKTSLMVIGLCLSLAIFASVSFSDVYYADSVFSYDGVSVDTPADGLSYATNNQTIETPDNYFSLGHGGVLIVEFTCPILNGEGDDLEIIETTNPCNWTSETAEIYASSCGTAEDDFVLIGTAFNDMTGGNVNYTNNSTKFDLGDLQCAKYIKIVDTTADTSNENYDFDLNSVASLQPNPECEDCDCGGGGTQEDCINEVSTLLLAGQTMEVGSIIVSEDNGTICVSYETTGDWYIKEIHLAIETSPDFFIVNKSGNPKVGQFEFTECFDPMVQETPPYCKDFTDTLSGYIYIAAHAVVVKVVDGEEVQTETGWSNGEGFPGKNWAMYYEYDPECIPMPEPTD